MTDTETDGNYTRLRILLLHIIMWVDISARDDASILSYNIFTSICAQASSLSVYWKCITSTN